MTVPARLLMVIEPFSETSVLSWSARSPQKLIVEELVTVIVDPSLPPEPPLDDELEPELPPLEEPPDLGR